jgi:hypothetical protein
MWGGPATFQANGNNYIVEGDGNPLNTYLLGLSPVSLSVESTVVVPGQPCLVCRVPGGQPIVSSNGTTSGTAIAWAIQGPGNAGGNLSLLAFDALNLSHVLYYGVAGVWQPTSAASYIGGAFISPTVANGRVYVPVQNGVAVFGL